MDNSSKNRSSESLLFSIGAFSRITSLSLKALRLYHEKGILVPVHIDKESGYRHYNHANVERARIINALRDLDFSLNDISDILENCEDESETLEYLEKQRAVIVRKMTKYRTIAISLDHIIQHERESFMKSQQNEFEVEEKEIEGVLIAGIRYQGKYNDCGKAFSKISKTMGRFICGKPINLYYDCEYKEDDADIETCMPVRKAKEVDGVKVRELKGGLCVSLIHKGPYDELSRSYEKITAYVNEKCYDVQVPSREIYLKGPGMIFKGNPKNYITEIQMMLKD